MYQTLDEFTNIGRLSSTHGLEGHVHFVHHLKGKNILKKFSFIFIEVKPSSYIPYKFSIISNSSDTDAIIKLDKVDDVDAAKPIAGKAVFLPTKLYDEIQPKDVTLNFTGFTLYNQFDRKVGLIESIFESPGQLLASVTLENGNEALVPLVEQFILSINANKRELTLNIPDGLIEMYL